MKRKLILVLTVLLCVLLMPITARAATQDGWKKENDVWYYYQGGVKYKGWLEYEGNTYYMTPAMATGYQHLQGKDGKMHYYYFGDKNGYMLTGWKQDSDGAWHYLKASDGSAITGFATIEDTLYYFEKNGNMAIGNFTVDQTYDGYAKSNGHVLTNVFLEQQNNWGDTFRLFIDDTGMTRTGMFYLTGDYPLYVPTTKYPDTEGKAAKQGTVSTNAGYAVEDGVLARDKFVTIDGHSYYFGTDYKMKTGIIQRDGKIYGISETGELYKGETEIDGNTYYFDLSTGEAYIGWKDTTDGRKYYNENGVLQKGFFEFDWKPVWTAEKSETLGAAGEYAACYDYARNHPNGEYFSENWPETTNYLVNSFGTSTFYADPDTGLIQTGQQIIDGKTYQFEEKGNKDSLYGISYKGAMKKCYWEKTEDGRYRFFNEDGVMQTGLFSTKYSNHYAFHTPLSAAQVYYAGADGYCKTGWIQLTEGKRYFKPAMAVSQWIQDGEDFYYVDQKGVAQTGLITIITCRDTMEPAILYERFEKGIHSLTGANEVSRKVYYLGEDGVCQYGRVRFNEGIREFDTEGVMRTDTTITFERTSSYDENTGLVTSVPHLTYLHFDEETGILQTGFVNVEGTARIIENYGMTLKSGVRYINEDGTAQIGWKTMNGKTYYFEGEVKQFKPSGSGISFDNDNATGKMKIGWAEIGEAIYFFRSGVMQTGWQAISGKWYHFAADGKMTTKWYSEGSKWYYLDPQSGMATGWKQIGKFWYFFRSDGSMHTGWRQLKGAWYYFDTNGRMQTGWKKIGSIWYCFDQNGKMRTGWYSEAGEWYFLKNGAMKTGWQKISGNWYFFYKSGKMARNTVIGGYAIDTNGICINP